MPAINVPAAPAKAVFMNALRDRTLSCGLINGCRLYQISVYQLSYTPSKSFPPSFTDQLRTKTIELEPDSASEKIRSARECTTVHSKLQIKRSSASRGIRCSYIRISISKLKSDDPEDLPDYPHRYLIRNGIPIFTNTRKRA
jgi:hypothetical protein